MVPFGTGNVPLGVLNIPNGIEKTLPPFIPRGVRYETSLFPDAVKFLPFLSGLATEHQYPVLGQRLDHLWLDLPSHKLARVTELQTADAQQKEKAMMQGSRGIYREADVG